MNTKYFSLLASSALALSLSGPASAAADHDQYIRLAELEIDPAQLENFKVAITEGVQTAIRVEPDVLVLYAVFEKEHPTRVKVFEMYTDETAYQKHLQTPHFIKFRDGTAKMVTSRKLLDAIPMVLGAKSSPTAPSK